MAFIFTLLAILAALAAGLAAGYMYRKNVQEKKIGRTEEYARNLLDDAQRRAEEKKKESILEAKEEVIRLKNELDREIRDRRAEVQRSERRVTQREETLDKKADNLDARETGLERKQNELDRLTAAELFCVAQAMRIPLPGASTPCGPSRPISHRTVGRPNRHRGNHGFRY